MRKIETIRRPCYVARLRCRKCGKKQTFYLGFEKKDNPFPTHYWNGWYMNNTEICPRCVRKLIKEELIDLHSV